MMIDVRLKAIWVERVGYRYDLLLDGEVIVSGSRDPEFDCARILVARGLRGRFRTIDFFTGRPRMMHDIERAAGFCKVDRDDAGVLVVPYRPMSEEDRTRARLHRTAQGRAGTPGAALDSRERSKRAGGESAATANSVRPASEDAPTLSPALAELESV